MGFPITAQVVGGGHCEDFPLYAWFIDRADGPVWKEMDAAFDKWDKRTGRHVAFFVDPFQKETWAADFLKGVLGNPEASQAVLDARREAQRFFRERLAERACRELWLPQERLPVALVGCRWDARTTVAVPLATREDVRRLLELLTEVGERFSQPRPKGRDAPWRAPGEEMLLAELERVLGPNQFEHRRTVIHIEMSRFGRGERDDDWRGPFTDWLRERATSPWTGAGPHLAGAVTHVALSSFDDLLGLARTLVDGADEVARRHPGDRRAAEVARYLPIFIDAVRTLHSVRSRLRSLADTGLRSLADTGGILDVELLESGATAVIKTPLIAPGFAIEARVAQRVGADTFACLQADSRAALVASEAICVLSEAISELHLDLTAVLLGYWKASEIEGRKLIIDLIIYAGIPVTSRGAEATAFLDDIDAVQRRFTAGSIGYTLCNAGLVGIWSELPLATLGKRYERMAQVTRNRFIHRDNLQDAAVLFEARSLVAEPPDGILPMAVRCMGAVENMGASTDEPPQMVTQLLNGLEWNNASAAVPKALADLQGRARGAYAKGAVAKLGARWLEDPKRAERDWVAELLAAVPRDGAAHE